MLPGSDLGATPEPGHRGGHDGHQARSAAAGGRFAELLRLSGDVAWSAEIEVAPGIRVDVFGQRMSGDGVWPVCVVEAKIHQALGEKQFLDYADWLSRASALGDQEEGNCVLALLVPVSRLPEMQRFLEPLSVPSHLRVQVVTWEEGFAALREADVDPDVRCDLAQLEELYSSTTPRGSLRSRRS